MRRASGPGRWPSRSAARSTSSLDRTTAAGLANQVPGIAVLTHARLLAQAHRGLRADPAIQRRERPCHAARKGQAHAFQLLREFGDHISQRAAIHVAHRAHLRGQPRLQAVRQVGQRYIGALVQQKPHDDRRLLRAGQMRRRAAPRRAFYPCQWCAHALIPVALCYLDLRVQGVKET